MSIPFACLLGFGYTFSISSDADDITYKHTCMDNNHESKCNMHCSTAVPHVKSIFGIGCIAKACLFVHFRTTSIRILRICPDQLFVLDFK